MVHGLSFRRSGVLYFYDQVGQKRVHPRAICHMLRGPPSRKDGGGAAVASHLLQKEEPREHVSQTPQNADGENLQR